MYWQGLWLQVLGARRFLSSAAGCNSHFTSRAYRQAEAFLDEQGSNADSMEIGDFFAPGRVALTPWLHEPKNLWRARTVSQISPRFARRLSSAASHRLSVSDCRRSNAPTAMKNQASMLLSYPFEVPIQRGFPLESEIGNFRAYTLRFKIPAPISKVQQPRTRVNARPASLRSWGACWAVSEPSGAIGDSTRRRQPFDLGLSNCLNPCCSVPTWRSMRHGWLPGNPLSLQ
jgi:hypothetical protein